MFDYIGKIMKNMIHLRTSHVYPDVKYAYKVPTISTNISSIHELSKDQDKRMELLNLGHKYV